MSVSQTTSLYSRDFVVSSVSRHFPYSRDFVVSPVSKHFPYSRDFVVFAVFRHFWTGSGPLRAERRRREATREKFTR